MTTYKPGEEWKQTLNENVFLKMRVQELQDENETLRIEIIEMRNTADQTDEILEEVIDSIESEPLCLFCGQVMVWSNFQLAMIHEQGKCRLCGVGHDPSGNEY